MRRDPPHARQFREGAMSAVAEAGFSEEKILERDVCFRVLARTS
jgi:hypothetical protein